MTNFDRIKKMLNGSTTMPQGTAMGSPVANQGPVHSADGSCCGHSHSHEGQTDKKNKPCCDHGHKD